MHLYEKKIAFGLQMNMQIISLNRQFPWMKFLNWDGKMNDLSDGFQCLTLQSLAHHSDLWFPILNLKFTI